MPKYYATGRVRKYAKAYRKRRFSSKLSRSKYSISPRSMHMPLPSRMNVSLRATEVVTVSYLGTAGVDSFLYPLYFPGLWKDNTGTASFAGGFLQLIQLYSQCRVKKVYMKTRMMAINNGNNVNLNLYTMICAENNAITLASITDTGAFQDNSNTWLAKKHYLSTSTGGHPYTIDVRSCDLTKYNGMVNSNDTLIYSNYTTQFTTPSSGQAQLLPCYVIVAKNIAGVTTLEVQFEFTFDFDMEFSGLKNLGQQISVLPTPTFARRT